MSFSKIEGIPGPGATAYSAIVARSPVMQDFYRDVIGEISSRASTKRILDIGTGPGYIPLAIAQKSLNVEIKAIDISPAMLEIARNNARNAGMSDRCEFKYGSARNIPYPDGYFDLVISTLSFHHWAERKNCLKEIYRVLSPRGEAWIYEIRQDMTKEAKRQLRSKYGQLLSFIILYFVRLHSSVRLKEFQEIASSPQTVFSESEVEDRGITIKLRLLK